MHVLRDPKKIRNDEALSPTRLTRDNLDTGVRLTIADGYRGACATSVDNEVIEVARQIVGLT